MPNAGRGAVAVLVGDQAIAGAEAFGHDPVATALSGVGEDFEALPGPGDGVVGALEVVFIAGLLGQVAQVGGNEDAHGMDVRIRLGGDGAAATVPSAALKGCVSRSDSEPSQT